jgi:hypothetical protein
MSKWIASAFFCTGLVIACGGGGGGGGGSGVSGSKQLVDLNDAEITDICEYLADLAGAPRMVTCDGETLTIEAQSVAECSAGINGNIDMFPDCAATVDNFEGCAEAIDGLSDDGICALFGGGALPAACTALSGPGCV